MSEFKGTPHNHAKLGEIAKTVLMPGDPLRAKFIADTFLENVKEFNSVRGMLGFTGTYKGVEVSVMGSGMGMPSMGIYSYELYEFYGVENIIRVGTAGGYKAEHNLFDVLIAEAAFSKSSYAEVGFGYTERVLEPTSVINDQLKKSAAEIGKTLKGGMFHSSDVFYSDPVMRGKFGEFDPDCVEMESFALFANAKYLNKNAACIATISDSFVLQKQTTAQERQTAFVDMMEIALEAAIKL